MECAEFIEKKEVLRCIINLQMVLDQEKDSKIANVKWDILDDAYKHIDSLAVKVMEK